MIKAIFLDVDGTLISHTKGDIPASALKTLAEIQARGTLVFLATGRHRVALEKLPLHDFPFDGYVTLTGHICYDREWHILSEVPFSPDDTQELERVFREKKHAVVVIHEDCQYINTVNESVERLMAAVSSKPPEVEEWHTGETVYNAALYADPEDAEKVIARMPGCRLSAWHTMGYDIISKEAGKVQGIRKMMEKFGLRREEIAVFGDGDNDVEMLSFAGIGVAMGNGTERAREAADFVTASVDDDGLARGIARLRPLLAGAEEKTDLAERVEKELRENRHFHEKLFSRFAKAVTTYEMISPGDRIAVCISGGKDSMLMAKLFQELKRHNKFPFELTFLVMDPGYNQNNRELLERNAKNLGVPVTVFESDIFDVVDGTDRNPCYLCARMRRGNLYAKAKELGCNKIALGHHFDDVIETTLMGMLWSGQLQAMMPKLHSQNFEGMELIRPMYFVREEDIEKWRDHYGLLFLQCACHFTEEAAAHPTTSKRLETKMLIRELRKTNPGVEANIFNSMSHVALDAVLAWQTGGVTHSFLENYDEKGRKDGSV